MSHGVIVLQKILWVPLDAQYESMYGAFDGLNDAVGRARHCDQAFTYLFKSLVVTAIHMQRRGRIRGVSPSNRTCQKAINLELHDVGQVITLVLWGAAVMFPCRGYLTGNVLMESPSSGDVEHLHAPADSQQRHIITHGSSGQPDLDLIPKGIHSQEFGFNLFTIELRRDVSSTRQQ